MATATEPMPIGENIIYTSLARRRKCHFGMAGGRGPLPAMAEAV